MATLDPAESPSSSPQSVPGTPKRHRTPTRKKKSWYAYVPEGVELYSPPRSRSISPQTRTSSRSPSQSSVASNKSVGITEFSTPSPLPANSSKSPGFLGGKSKDRSSKMETKESEIHDAAMTEDSFHPVSPKFSASRTSDQFDAITFNSVLDVTGGITKESFPFEEMVSTTESSSEMEIALPQSEEEKFESATSAVVEHNVQHAEAEPKSEIQEAISEVSAEFVSGRLSLSVSHGLEAERASQDKDFDSGIQDGTVITEHRTTREQLSQLEAKEHTDKEATHSTLDARYLVQTENTQDKSAFDQMELSQYPLEDLTQGDEIPATSFVSMHHRESYEQSLPDSKYLQQNYPDVNDFTSHRTTEDIVQNFERDDRPTTGDVQDGKLMEVGKNDQELLRELKPLEDRSLLLTGKKPIYSSTPFNAQETETVAKIRSPVNSEEAVENALPKVFKDVSEGEKAEQVHTRERGSSDSRSTNQSSVSHDSITSSREMEPPRERGSQVKLPLDLENLKPLCMDRGGKESVRNGPKEKEEESFKALGRADMLQTKTTFPSNDSNLSNGKESVNVPASSYIRYPSDLQSSKDTTKSLDLSQTTFAKDASSKTSPSKVARPTTLQTPVTDDSLARRVAILLQEAAMEERMKMREEEARGSPRGDRSSCSSPDSIEEPTTPASSHSRSSSRRESRRYSGGVEERQDFLVPGQTGQDVTGSSVSSADALALQVKRLLQESEMMKQGKVSKSDERAKLMLKSPRRIKSPSEISTSSSVRDIIDRVLHQTGSGGESDADSEFERMSQRSRGGKGVDVTRFDSNQRENLRERGSGRESKMSSTSSHNTGGLSGEVLELLDRTAYVERPSLRSISRNQFSEEEERLSQQQAEVLHMSLKMELEAGRISREDLRNEMEKYQSKDLRRSYSSSASSSKSGTPKHLGRSRGREDSDSLAERVKAILEKEAPQDRVRRILEEAERSQGQGGPTRISGPEDISPPPEISPENISDFERSEFDDGRQFGALERARDILAGHLQKVNERNFDHSVLSYQTPMESKSEQRPQREWELQYDKREQRFSRDLSHLRQHEGLRYRDDIRYRQDLSQEYDLMDRPDVLDLRDLQELRNDGEFRRGSNRLMDHFSVHGEQQVQDKDRQFIQERRDLSEGLSRMRHEAWVGERPMSAGSDKGLWEQEDLYSQGNSSPEPYARSLSSNDGDYHSLPPTLSPSLDPPVRDVLRHEYASLPSSIPLPRYNRSNSTPLQDGPPKKSMLPLGVRQTHSRSSSLGRRSDFAPVQPQPDHLNDTRKAHSLPEAHMGRSDPQSLQSLSANFGYQPRVTLESAVSEKGYVGYRSNTSGGSGKLRAYRPSAGSPLMYTYPPRQEGDRHSSMVESTTTMESTHTGSDDAQPPDFPPHVFGSRQETPRPSHAELSRSLNGRRRSPSPGASRIPLFGMRKTLQDGSSGISSPKQQSIQSSPSQPIDIPIQRSRPKRSIPQLRHSFPNSSMMSSNIPPPKSRHPHQDVRRSVSYHPDRSQGRQYDYNDPSDANRRHSSNLEEYHGDIYYGQVPGDYGTDEITREDLYERRVPYQPGARQGSPIRTREMYQRGSIPSFQSQQGHNVPDAPGVYSRRVLQGVLQGENGSRLEIDDMWKQYQQIQDRRKLEKDLEGASTTSSGVTEGRIQNLQDLIQDPVGHIARNIARDMIDNEPYDTSYEGHAPPDVRQTHPEETYQRSDQPVMMQRDSNQEHKEVFSASPERVASDVPRKETYPTETAPSTAQKPVSQTSRKPSKLQKPSRISPTKGIPVQETKVKEKSIPKPTRDLKAKRKAESQDVQESGTELVPRPSESNMSDLSVDSEQLLLLLGTHGIKKLSSKLLRLQQKIEKQKEHQKKQSASTKTRRAKHALVKKKAIPRPAHASTPAADVVLDGDSSLVREIGGLLSSEDQSITTSTTTATSLTPVPETSREKDTSLSSESTVTLRDPAVMRRDPSKRVPSGRQELDLKARDDASVEYGSDIRSDTASDVSGSCSCRPQRPHTIHGMPSQEAMSKYLKESTTGALPEHDIDEQRSAFLDQSSEGDKIPSRIPVRETSSNGTSGLQTRIPIMQDNRLHDVSRRIPKATAFTIDMSTQEVDVKMREKEVSEEKDVGRKVAPKKSKNGKRDKNGNQENISPPKPSKLTPPGVAWFQPLKKQMPWQRAPSPKPKPITIPVREGSSVTESKLTLQEAFFKHRADFVSQSKERQRKVRLAAEERYLQANLELERARLFEEERRRKANPLAHPYSDQLFNPKKRTITRREMKEQTQKIYSRLPEVVKQKEQNRKQQIHETNRLRAQLYRKKLSDKMKGRSGAFQ